VRAYASAAVEYLERHFMGSEAPPSAPPAPEPSAPARPSGPPLCAPSGSPGVSREEGVRFLLASGQRAEAELAAEKIAHLLRSGFRPGEVAVIVRDIRSWSRLLGDVFDSCGIPYRLDDRSLVRETGLGYAFLSALRGVALDDAQALLSYLRSPYSGLTLEQASDLELAYRRGTARGAQALAVLAADRGLAAVKRLWALVGQDSWQAPVDRGFGSPDRATGSGAPLGTRVAPSRAPNGDVGRFVPAAAEDLVRGMLVAGLRGLPLGDRSAKKDARAFRALQGAFAALTALNQAYPPVADPGGSTRERDEVATPASGWLDPRLVLRYLSQVPVPGESTKDDDVVEILSVHRARARRFQAVVVLGLVEGEFPGHGDKPSLLSAVQRARLDEVGGGFLRPEPDQEAAFFLSAVSRPWRLLLLSARDADDDGTESVPSHYWQEARRLLGVAEVGPESRTLADQVFSPRGAPSLRHYLRACVAHGRMPHPDAVPRGATAAPSWGRPPTRLTDPAVVAELASTHCFSPSALESYAGCPFKWFVEKIVGAEDVEVELDGRVIGQLLHGVLSETYCALSAAGLLPLKTADVPRAERIVDACIDRQVWSDRCPGTPAERRLAAWRLRRMARNLFDMEVQAASSLTFSQGERWVGGSHGADIGGLRVRGRIDRVDVTPDGRGMFIFDYKTGSIPSGRSLGSKDGLQLPLYLLALAAESPGGVVVGGAYLSLAEKGRSGVVHAGWEWALGSGTQGIGTLSEVEAEELWRRTRETAAAAAEGIRAGLIAPRDDRTCPHWCALGPACRARRREYRP